MKLNISSINRINLFTQNYKKKRKNIFSSFSHIKLSFTAINFDLIRYGWRWVELTAASQFWVLCVHHCSLNLMLKTWEICGLTRCFYGELQSLRRCGINNSISPISFSSFSLLCCFQRYLFACFLSIKLIYNKKKQNSISTRYTFHI